MPKTLQDLNKMANGDLLRSQDWNDFVNEVLALRDDLAKKVTDAETQIAKTAADLGNLQTEFDAYRKSTDSVIGQFYRVDLQTVRQTYAIGELAEISVQVTDPRANALEAPGDKGLPWVDFVTTWGRLSAAPNFDSIPGDGDRSISVRVDANGVAKALLRSDHAEGFTIDDEKSVSSSLATKMQLQGGEKSLAELVVQSDTPMQLKTVNAFKALTQVYQQPETTTMRRYTDTFYLKHAAEISGKVVPIRPVWRDYRATVLAFAKSDNDPTTPDLRRGSDSILVTFRDWITPWINLEFLHQDEIAAEVPNLRDRFASKVTANYLDTAHQLRQEVDAAVQDDGLLGKMRKFQVADRALDVLNVANQPDFLPILAQAVQQGVRMQHSVENAQAATVGGATQNVAFQAITSTATQAQTQASGIDAQISDLKLQIGQFKGQVDSAVTNLGTLQSSVSTINGRIESAFSEGGELSGLRAEIGTVKGQVQGFQLLNPTDVQSRLSEVIGLSNRLTAIEHRVG